MKPMRVGILGGGPAGLYTAILLKNANPNHEIQVIERNPAGATFGFGVVLSDKTQTAFQQADRKTYDEITAHQATWTAVESYHRGVPVRCGGHYYLGIGRKRLLDILQRRCQELGVKLEFEREAPGPAVFGDFDLVVAADGVNSVTRRQHNEHFQATVTPSQSKYIWLGVETTPTAFTFIFHSTEHGVFQAHMYPFDDTMSTCIVQCREETWRKAGLDQLDESASVEFCKDLLKPYLGDANFFANRSLWSTFNMVKTANWSRGNTVLVGDAVHTAHWSIGSGTKLAMQGAIALVAALQNHENIPEALVEYQKAWQPAAERFQAAGRVSELYCENIDDHMHLEPLPFAFQLFTRSGRISYDDLKHRDPAFVAEVEKWYGGAPPV